MVDTAGRIDKFKNRYAGLSLKNQKSTNENLPVSEEVPSTEVPAAVEEDPTVEEAPATEDNSSPDK